MFFNEAVYQWVASSHLIDQAGALLNKPLLYGRETGTLMEPLNAQVAGQSQRYTNGPILNFLQYVKSCLWTMKKTDRSIFKNGSYIYLIKLYEGLGFGTTPCQYS